MNNKPFNDLTDWERQFENDKSERRRTGALHALLDGEEFVCWPGTSEQEVGEALLKAIGICTRNAQFVPTSKAMQILFANVFQCEPSDSGAVKHLYKLNILTLEELLSLSQAGVFNHLMMGKELQKQIDLYLETLCSNEVFLGKIDSSARKLLINVVLKYGRSDIFLDPKWIGENDVMAALKKHIRRFVPYKHRKSFAQLVISGIRYRQARELAQHYAATGSFDHLVKI